MKEFIELFNDPIIEFKSHLIDEDNERIIFSGIYGIGKTTFIKHFFDSENQKEILGKVNFKPLYLTPVNYSISSNEDIFSYIKSDILLQLLAESDLKIDPDFSHKDSLPFYIMNNIDSVIELLQNTLSKIEKKTIEIPSKLIELLTGYTKYHNKLNTATENLVQNFNLNLIQKEGSLYEFNPISEIITKLIDDLKQKSNTKSILIIDDLDRIDPAHIFRLFNVFASHFDYHSKNDNKFGFDKIMFVCDIDNIRNIFRHIYGTDVDFNGYIDKFYSKNIFHFNIRSSLVGMIQNVLRSITYSDDPRTDQYFKGKMVDARQLVSTLKELIIQRKLNLRSFFKYYDKKVAFTNDDIPFINHYNKISSHPAILEIRLLIDMYDDTDSLINALEFCRNNMMRNKFLEEPSTLSSIVYLLDIHQNNLNDNGTEFTFKDPDSRFFCRYKVLNKDPNTYSAQIIDYSPAIDSNNNINYKFNNLLYYQLLLVKQLKKIGYVK